MISKESTKSKRLEQEMETTYDLEKEYTRGAFCFFHSLPLVCFVSFSTLSLLFFFVATSLFLSIYIFLFVFSNPYTCSLAWWYGYYTPTGLHVIVNHEITIYGVDEGVFPSSQ